MNTLPLVALVGRPNVGKSTIFNRITGKKTALVKDQPGITRDLNYGDAAWTGYHFKLVDMGGLDFEASSEIEKKMTDQALMAIEDASVMLLIMDIKAGVTAKDKQWIKKIRKLDKPIVAVLNKVDSINEDHKMAEFYELGISEFILIASESGRGMGDLLDAVVNTLKSIKSESESTQKLAKHEIFYLSLVGRPNVGKSTLINHLLGENRSIVSSIPGTTRDPVNSFLEYEEDQYCLVDTAGIRKRGRIDEVIEKFSVIKSIDSVKKSDCVLFLVDGFEGITDQDAHVLGEAFKRHKSVIILVNKWDIAASKFSLKEIENQIERKLGFTWYAPMLLISAKTGKNVDKIFPKIKSLKKQLHYRVGTGELNRFFQEMISNHPLPVYKGKNIKIYYMTQISVNPPEFIVFANFPDKIHFSYERYMINCLRNKFPFKEVPIKLIFRKKS
jgi:GTP-binding protein